jgi:hypothetical protein
MKKNIFTQNTNTRGEAFKKVGRGETRMGGQAEVRKNSRTL